MAVETELRGISGPSAPVRSWIRPEFGQGGHRRSVAMVGTFPPTACGVATFTSNLRSAIVTPSPGWGVGVVRIVDCADRLSDPVVEEWIRGDAGSLRHCLAALNRFDAVVLQHEYGLFDGTDGASVVELVDGLNVPLLAVLHTALLEPSPNQRRILERIIDAAAVVVVQSEAARRRVLAVHGVDPALVVVVPHGAAANFSGPAVPGTVGPSVLTWGLLSPGKGIEHGIAAVSRLWSETPALSYLVAGQTHPKVRALRGESYRGTLQALARSLGADGRVGFDDAYRDWDSLRALVRSADVVLLPYDSRDQVSSGVLVEALASGKPVVATRFPHAEELLASGAGILVDHGDVAAMADALRRVLGPGGEADRMAAAARVTARRLLWPAVGASYRDLIERAIGQRAVA